MNTTLVKPIKLTPLVRIIHVLIALSAVYQLVKVTSILIRLFNSLNLFSIYHFFIDLTLNILLLMALVTTWNLVSMYNSLVLRYRAVVENYEYLGAKQEQVLKDNRKLITEAKEKDKFINQFKK